MSGSRRARAAQLGAAVLLCVVGTACSSRASAVGAGDDVDYCVAVIILDRFREPRPESRDEVLEYAEGFIRVIDRVDVRRELRVPDDQADKIPKPKVSDDAMGDLRVLRESMVRLREAVRQTRDDGVAVRTATDALAADEGYAAAERRTTAYFAATCKSD